MILYQRAGWLSFILLAVAVGFSMDIGTQEAFFIAAVLAALANLTFWLVLRAMNNDHHQTLFFLHIKYWSVILPVLIVVIGRA